MYKVINSGAGTGKTYYMQSEINKLSSDSSRKILGITFTNMARENMLSSIKTEKVSIATLHSLVFSQHKLANSNWTLVDKNLITSVLAGYMNHYNTNSNINIYDVMNMYSSWLVYCYKNLGSSQCDYEGFRKLVCDKIRFNTAEFIDLFMYSTKINYCVEQMLQLVLTLCGWVYREKVMDLGDVILWGCFEFTDSYTDIFVDEFQDLTYLEFELVLNKIKHENLYILCDNKQSIYHWRGSAFKENLLRVKELGEVEVIQLNRNYRSSKQLVCCSNAVTGRTDTSELEEVGEVRIFNQLDYNGMDMHIKNIITKHGKNIGILCQTNVEAFRVSQLLNLNNVEHMLKIRSTYSDIPLLQTSLDLFRVIMQPYNSETLYRYLLNPEMLKVLGVSNIEMLKFMKSKISMEFIRTNTNILKSIVEGSKKDIIVFDLETNSLDTETAEIVQIGAIKLDSSLNEISRFNKLIRIKGSVGDSVKTHLFTDAILAEDGESTLKVLKEFINYITGCTIFAHNLSYDIAVLSRVCLKEFEINIFSALGIDIHCTLDLTKTLYPSQNSYKLGELNSDLGLGCEPNHNAIFDVECTVELLKLLVNTYKNNEGKYIERMRSNIRVIEKIRGFLVCNRIGSLYNLSGCIDFQKKVLGDIKLDDTRMEIQKVFISKILTLESSGATKMQMYENIFLDNFTKADTKNITVCTVHQSKGLEWDSVIYILTNDTKVSSLDNINVEYVALSRAKRNFYLLVKQKVNRSILMDKLGGVLC